MININKIKNYLLVFAPYIIMILMPISILAQTPPVPSITGAQAGDILLNISQDFPSLIYWLNGLCTVIGISFMLLAFFKFKHLADFRTMTGGQQEVGKAFMMLAMGAIFLWMPFIINVMTYSLFGLTVGQLRSSYTISPVNHQYQVAFFKMMSIIGLISFIRGWLILSSLAKGQSQPGTIGKAITHIIAGLFLYHLLAVMKIFENTMGVTFI